MERPIEIDEIQGLWTYLLSIDWSDPWFRYLLLFHIVCIIITVLIRNRSMLQIFYFGLLLMAVFFSENINEWAAKNYKLFSRQQYFDSNGLFISTVFSTPILINCLIMVVMWLVNMSTLMADLSRVKHKRNKKHSKDHGSEDTSNDKEKKEKGD